MQITPIKQTWIGYAEIFKMIDVTRSGLHTLMRNNGFPQPIRINHRVVKWNIEDVQRWMTEQEAARC